MNKIFKIIYLTTTLSIMIILQPLVLLIFAVDSWQKKTSIYENQTAEKTGKVEFVQYKVSQELQVWT